MAKCYVAEMQEIFDEINATLVKKREKTIKRGKWHEALSQFTANKILPHWVNQCFRKGYFNSLDAAKVQTAIEEHLKSLGLTRSVTLICDND